MPTPKLTKAVIEKIAAPDPSGNQRIVWDADLKGFGLLVSGKTDAKTYVVQRRLPDGRTRRLTIGAVGEFDRVEDARRKAGTLLLGLRDGKDPKAERRKAAARDRTLRYWLDSYLTARKDLRERSVEEYRRGVTRHLEPWLDRPLREITPDMVEDKHAAIGKSAGPAAANGTMRALRAMWNFALDRDGTLAANPVRRLKRAWFDTPPRTRMVRTDELPRFYTAVDALPNHAAADYLKLLLFTGLRRREAAALRWDEVDLAARVMRLPATKTKAKRKLDLPMSDFVRDLLISRRAIGNDGGWVFGANSASGHIEEPKGALAAVAKAAGISVSAHDLRRTFVTVAEGTDI
ncbi:MAG TPA: integrase arm-type DNA-binding domain-containing protein, partial [Stellaceae bacterium]|nr:integrase arm-type DNA-binding domain-containing protein [Stellaceae bacterium]